MIKNYRMMSKIWLKSKKSYKTKLVQQSLM